jgi:hypothetical protein
MAAATPSPCAEAPVELHTTTDLVLQIASDDGNRKREEISKGLLAQNPDLGGVDVRRNGEQVTLSLELRRNGSPVRLDLQGKKTDFYRLAVGEKPDETLRGLVQGDPRIESTGVERTGRQLVLRISYRAAAPARPDAAPAPAAAPTAPMGEMQAEYEAAARAGTPEALQAFMAKWGSAFKAQKDGRRVAGHTSTRAESPPPLPAAVPRPAPPPVAAAAKAPVPETPTIRVKGLPEGGLAALSQPPPVPPSAPPPAPKPDPSAEAADAFRAALAAGTVEALTKFLSEHPAAPQVVDARKEIERLGDELAYRQAVAQDQLSVYQAFTARFANSPHRGDIDGRIQRIQQERLRGEMEQNAREAENDRRRRAFEQARSLNTPEAYRIFLATYPGSAEDAEAKKKLRDLEQQTKDAEDEKRRKAFGQAKALNTAEAFRVFAATYPGSPEEAEAQRRVREIEQRALEAETDKASRAFQQALSLDTAEAYRMFLATYAGAPEQPKAQKRLAEIEADDETFERARHSEKALEAYLAERPHGRRVSEAREELRDLKDERMRSDYLVALAVGTPAAVEGFLAKWPGSPKTGEAKAALEALKQRSPQKGGKEVAAETMPTTPAPKEVKLVARQVRSAPAIDGKADDAAWRDIAPVDVPVEGPGGRNTVHVRAVHDGSSIYVLAEWSDGSRDVSYRPWVWDAKAKKYHQSEKLDDAFSVGIYRGEPPSAACMLDGANVEADIWLWRAQWSSVSRLADDGRLRVSRTRIAQANPYPARNGGGQVWVQEDWDDGAQGWALSIPTDYKGDELPSYHTSQGRGSRADVKAVGNWANGTWTVEFARALDTGHADDVPLRKGEVRAVAFAVFNKANRDRHSSSPVVRLDLLAK